MCKKKRSKEREPKRAFKQITCANEKGKSKTKQNSWLCLFFLSLSLFSPSFLLCVHSLLFEIDLVANGERDALCFAANANEPTNFAVGLFLNAHVRERILA